MKIFKYKIKPTFDGEIQHMPIPWGAIFLNAEFQYDELFIWALVDEKHGPEDYLFQIWGTGIELNGIARNFLKTVFNSGFVYHIFWKHQ